MRLLLTLFNLAAYLLGAGQTNSLNDPFVNAQKKITISGHIKNYVPGNTNRFIRFRTYDVSGRGKDTTIFIDKAGHFALIKPTWYAPRLAEG